MYVVYSVYDCVCICNDFIKWMKDVCVAEGSRLLPAINANNDRNKIEDFIRLAALAY